MNTSSTFDYAALRPSVQPCPLCDGLDFEPLARHDRNLIGLRTVGCRTCGLIQTNPRPSAEGLDAFYRDHYRIFYQGAATPDARYVATLNKDVRLAYTGEFLAGRMGVPLSASLLDYGCGEGSLFAALRKAGFTGAFYGVEPNASFGEFASKQGNAIVSNTIRAREPVDLIVINHVLEHLADAAGTLRQLGALLAPGGRIYIDVPDADSYSSIHDLHIAHLYHFTERTLPGLVRRAGLRVSIVERHEPPFHPPSVRLVADRGDAGAAAPAFRPDLEQSAWNAVRLAGRARNTWRLRVRKHPIARGAYQWVKRLTKPPAP